MTENEAIRGLMFLKEKLYNGIYADRLDCIDYAISALEEIQQYREIGTVKEFREAVEKQKAKKHGTGGHANGMGDLISRKSLIEKLDEWCGSQTYLISEEVWKIIKNFPKAFDKEKVIDELKRMEEESCKEWNEYGDAASLGKVITFAEAIEIVERGGI